MENTRCSERSFAKRFGQASLFVAMAVGSVFVTANLGAVPPPGQLLAAQCFQCHGTDGRAVSGFEPIVGRSADDMYKFLIEVSRRRPENIMDYQARAFTPAQLRLMANYLATLPSTDEGL